VVDRAYEIAIGIEPLVSVELRDASRAAPPVRCRDGNLVGNVPFRCFGRGRTVGDCVRDGSA
jgi:hypothetical protein